MAHHCEARVNVPVKRLVFAGEAIVGLPLRAAGWRPGVLRCADPGPLVTDSPAAVLGPVLARCDWWSCNRREAALLTGSGDPSAAARRLVRRSDRAGILVRSGPDGCVLAVR